MTRPALHAVVSEQLPASINDFITENAADPDWYDNVEQVRFEITGDRLTPTTLLLHVISETELLPAHRAAWRKWNARGKRLLGKHQIRYVKMLFTTPDKTTARRYRDTMPLRIDNLPNRHFW